MSDEELLGHFYETGDQQSFTELVKSTEQEVREYLTRFTKDEHVAEDLTQEVFLQVVQKPERYERGKRVIPWLITIAKNLAIDRHRSNAAQIHNESTTGSIHAFENEVQIETADTLSGFIANADLRSLIESELPPDERDFVERVFFLGMSWNEAADDMGMSRGRTTRVMARALERLRKRLRQTPNNDAA